MMEVKVKGILNYYGNFSDCLVSKGDEMFSWLMEFIWWESIYVVIGLLFLLMFIFFCFKYCGEEEKENIIWVKLGVGGRNVFV